MSAGTTAGARENERGGATILTIITAVAAVLAALFGGAASVYGVTRTEKISERQATLQEAVQSLQVDTQSRQVTIEQQRLQAELAKRRDDVLSTQLVRLLSDDPNERLQARVLLLALVPNDLCRALASVRKALIVGIQEQGSVESFQAVLAGSNAVAQNTAWGIIVGGFAGRHKAASTARSLRDEGFTPVEVFSRGDYFYPTILEYPTQTVAEGVLVAVRSRGHPSAFVADLAQWRPSGSDQQDPLAVSCSSQAATQLK